MRVLLDWTLTGVLLVWLFTELLTSSFIDRITKNKYNLYLSTVRKWA